MSNPDGLADRDWVLAGTYEIEVAGVRIGATVSMDPFYDPKSARVRS